MNVLYSTSFHIGFTFNATKQSYFKVQLILYYYYWMRNWLKTTYCKITKFPCKCCLSACDIFQIAIRISRDDAYINKYQGKGSFFHIYIWISHMIITIIFTIHIKTIICVEYDQLVNAFYSIISVQQGYY